jgi:hypothetical protein
MVTTTTKHKPSDVKYEFSNLSMDINYLLNGAKDSDYAKAEGLQVNFVDGVQYLKLERNGNGTYLERVERELRQTLIDDQGNWKVVQAKVNAQGLRLRFMRTDEKNGDWWMSVSAENKVAVDIRDHQSDSVCQYCCKRGTNNFSCPLVIQQLGEEVSRTVYVFEKLLTVIYKVSP